MSNSQGEGGARAPHQVMSDLGYGGQWLVILRRSTVVFLCFCIAANLFYLFSGRRPTREQLALDYSFSSDLGQALLQRHREFTEFLHNHATQAEEALYLDYADSLISSAYNYDTSSRNNRETSVSEEKGKRTVSRSTDRSLDISLDTSFLGSFYFGLLQFTIQLLFIIVTTWRIWLLGALAGVAWGATRFSIYRGRDILGVLSNGRLFFSGMIVGLRKVTSKGEPDVHVPGLACLPQAPDDVVAASPFIPLLQHYKASNRTCTRLVSFIMSVKDLPAFLSPLGVPQVIEKTYGDVPMFRHAYFVLDRALVLHRMYQSRLQSFTGTEEEAIEAMTGELGTKSEKIPTYNDKIEIEDYADYLIGCFHRVLTPRMRVAFTRWTPSEVAAMVLALQAGKHLTYDKEVGDRWSVVSTFPELNARAAIHSISEYGEDYSYDRRTMVRRAIVYSCRSSVFEVNRLPADMDEDMLAGRQLAELILMPPHRLPAVTDEVELYGIARESFGLWKTRFLEVLGGPESTAFKERAFLAASGDMLFIPVPKLIEVAHSVLNHDLLRRMGELTHAVEQEKQRFISRKEDVAPHLGIVPPILSNAEMNELIRGHELTRDQAEDWLAMRFMLRNFSTLGQRISDKANGPSQMIYLVREKLKVYKTNNEEEPLKRSSEFNGSVAIAPIRTSFIDEVLGSEWKSGLTQPKRIHVPNTRKEYDALLASSDSNKDSSKSSGVPGDDERLRGNVQRIAAPQKTM